MYRNLRNLAVAAAVAVLPACASGSGGGPNPSQVVDRTVLLGDDQGVPTIEHRVNGSSVKTALTPMQAMASLQTGYGVVGVPVTMVDTAHRQIGNPRFVTRARIGNAAMSQFINCGSSLTRDHANQDQITMSVISTVSPNSDGTSTVTTMMSATAVDRSSGNVGDEQICASTGQLENAIYRAGFGVQQ